MGEVHKNQSGFGAIEGLLIILVLAVIGFGGYYVWHTQNANQPTSVTTSAAPKQNNVTRKSNVSTTQPSPSVVLSRQDYSFTAPAGWKYVTSHSGLGDVYEDADGNQIIVTEGLGYDNNVQADYVWQADAEVSNGVKILAKSPACTVAGTKVSFKGFTYTCDGNSTKTAVVVFVTAQGGEIHAGSNIYRLFYEGNDSLLGQYETILGTFTAK